MGADIFVIYSATFWELRSCVPCQWKSHMDIKSKKKYIKDILNNDITEHKYIRHETSLFNFIIFFS